MIQVRFPAKTKEDYQIFLQSSFWLELRRQKIRLVPRCEHCGTNHRLTCHHLFYRPDWNDTQLSDLQVLCWPCHLKVHGKTEKPNKSAGENRSRPLPPSNTPWGRKLRRMPKKLRKKHLRKRSSFTKIHKEAFWRASEEHRILNPVRKYS